MNSVFENRGVNVEYDKKVKNRLKRIEGQIRGVIRMIEEQKTCSEIVTQLSACRSAMDRSIAIMVGTNLETCLRLQVTEGEYANQDLVKDAIQLLVNNPTVEIDKERNMIDILLEIEEGIRSVIKMMDERKDCRNVVFTLSQYRGIIDGVIVVVVGKNIETCILRQIHEGEVESKQFVQDAINLLVKSK